MLVHQQVAEVRRRVRRTYRIAHRLAIGAARLGPGATTGWLASEMRRRRQSGATARVCNSSFIWVTAEPTATTLVWLHNYWSDAYRIDRPDITATLLNPDGRALDQWEVPLEPGATEVIDIRERCREVGVPIPFEGQLLLEAGAEGLVAGRPVQVFAEYRHDSGVATGVHGQYGLQYRPAGQGVGEMRVESRPGVRSAVVVVNAYEGPGGPRPMKASIEVRDADGRLRRSDLKPMAPRASQVVWLDDAFPGLGTFLGGRAGSARVLLPCPSSRLLSFVDYEGGARRVVNHGTVDARLSQQSGSPVDWRDSRYVVSAFALCDVRRDTTFSMINTWGPVPADCVASIRLSDSEGNQLAFHEVIVRRGALATVSARDVLVAADVTEPTVAHAEITMRPVDTSVESPVQTNVIVGVVDEGRLVGEMLVGGGFLNGPVPGGSGLLDLRRTRVFTRAYLDHELRTRIFVAHPVDVDGYEIVSIPTLTLPDLAGKHLGSVEFRLPPHGFRFLDVAETFPAAAAAGVRTGVVRVRATDARLIGAHLSEQSGVPGVTVDHLIGG